MGRGLSVFRRDGGVGGLMACGEKNERKVVRREDGR
jgi:predicted metalloprotease